MANKKGESKWRMIANGGEYKRMRFGVPKANKAETLHEKKRPLLGYNFFENGSFSHGNFLRNFFGFFWREGRCGMGLHSGTSNLVAFKFFLLIWLSPCLFLSLLPSQFKKTSSTKHLFTIFKRRNMRVFFAK